MADSTPKSYSTDPTLYLYTSLTAGSSHIITATSRLETILKANKIAFLALDVATDEKARMLWGRRAGKRKLPGLVRMGLVVGDLEEVEEWNEYGELQENIGAPPTKISTSSASTNLTPSKPPTAPMDDKAATAGGGPGTPVTIAMRQAGEEAAKKAGDRKAQNTTSSKTTAITSETLQKLDNSAPIPPPSGTVDAPIPITPEPAKSSLKLKAGESAVSSTSSVDAQGLDVPRGPTLMHRGSNVSSASAEEIRSVEQSQAITEEDEPDDEEMEAGHGSTGSFKASATSRATDADEGQRLPGSRTQVQAAASAEDAGQSVAD